MRKKLTKILLISLTLTLLAPYPEANAGEFRVYSANAYKQIERLNEPIELKATNNKAKTQLLVDFSGSMTHWIEIGINTLETVLPRLSRYSNIGLRTFSGRSESEHNVSYCTASKNLVPFGRNNSSAIVSGLKNTITNGSTPIEFALRKTISDDFGQPDYTYSGDRNGKNKKIVLVTDGDDTCGGDPCAYIRQVMQERSDISIDVIQLGNSNALACLANETGGTYYKVTGQEQFEVALEQTLQTEESNYRLSRETEDTYTEREYEPEEPTSRYEQPRRNQYRRPVAKGYKFVNYQ